MCAAIFMCALTSRPECVRTHAQFRGNIARGPDSTPERVILDPH